MSDNRCNQCEALMINGVYCHETGCPNAAYKPDDDDDDDREPTQEELDAIEAEEDSEE